MILDDLYQTITARMSADPEDSYTASLLADAPGKPARKMSEEATETLMAALVETPEAVVRESADLLYHLEVLWAACGVEPQQVWAELESRFGTSGHEEKATRRRLQRRVQRGQ